MTGDSVKSGQIAPHTWNIVNIGEEPYQLDVTWDIGAMGQSKHHIAHDYFNLTDELMNQDHKADSSLPECKSKKANYYVQRGCSFQMRHRLMAYIDRLIEKNEQIYEFRAEGRLNKVAIEKEVADHIVQKLHEQGRSSVGIKTCSNRELDNFPRTQDLEPLYEETSGFYIYNSSVITSLNRRIGEKPYIVEVNEIEAVDIDEKEDFQIADAIYNSLYKIEE